jgi:glutamate-1-semialdehyde 2,1-aminomutase
VRKAGVGMKMRQYENYRKAVLDCIQDLMHKGFVLGLGGNASVRVEGTNYIAVTPSQREHEELSPDDICVVDFDLNPMVDTGLQPSLETPMHISVYRNRLDVNAVVHTHQIFASVFSLINEPIPALFDEVTSRIGKVVEVVPYGLSGSRELLDNITARLDNRSYCYILQNHGALCLGTTLTEAKRNAELLEKAAKIYYYALSTGKEVTTLPQDMQELFDLFIRGNQDKEIERKKRTNTA